MKKIIALMVLSIILTGCFGGEPQTEDESVDTPVVEENSEDVEITGDEDEQDADDLGESQQVEDDSSDEDVSGVESETSAEAEAEQEVIDEFESDLEDIFKDLGV